MPFYFNPFPVRFLLPPGQFVADVNFRHFLMQDKGTVVGRVKLNGPQWKLWPDMAHSKELANRMATFCSPIESHSFESVV